MGTVLWFGKVKFVIYAKDHEPAHAHIIHTAENAEAKLNLVDWSVISSRGFSQWDLNRFIKYAKENYNSLIEEWRRFHEEN